MLLTNICLQYCITLSFERLCQSKKNKITVSEISLGNINFQYVIKPVYKDENLYRKTC